MKLRGLTMSKAHLGDYLEYTQPTKYIVSSEEYSNDYTIPVLTAGDTFLLGYTNDVEGIYPASKQNPIILFDDFTTATKWVDFPFKVKSSACKILTKKANKNLRYSYYAMRAINFDHSTHKRYWISQYSQLPIVDRSEEEKKIVVSVLDKIQSLIDLKLEQMASINELIISRFIEMFGDPIRNTKNLPEFTLPELGVFGRGVSKHRPRNAPELLGGKYPLIQTGDVAAAELFIKSYNSTYSEIGFRQSKMWSKGTLCITIAANIAKTAILSFDSCFPDSVVGFNANEKTDNIFIHYWFSFFQEILEAQAPASAQKNINLKTLSELKVIVPQKTEQESFVAFVKQVDKSKSIVKQQIKDLQELLDKKMDEYFNS